MPEVEPPALGPLLASMPHAVAIGVELTAASVDEVRGRLPWRADLCTIGGVLHGGALMTLADSLGAVCAFLNLPDGATGTATIESKTNFFRGVRDGVVDAASRPLHVGRSTIVVQTTLSRPDGELAAQTTQTQAVLGR